MTTNKVGLDTISSWRELIPRSSFQVNENYRWLALKINGDSVWSNFSGELQCDLPCAAKVGAMRVFVVSTSVQQTTTTQRWPDKPATA